MRLFLVRVPPTRDQPQRIGDIEGQLAECGDAFGLEPRREARGGKPSLAEIIQRIRLEIILPGDNAVMMLDEGKIDLIITPDYVISSGHPSELLYQERFLLAGWKENPVFSQAVTEEDFFSAGHVAVAIGSTGTASYADRQLEGIGRSRRVEVVAPFFSAVPWLLEGTMRLAILHERLARTLEGRFDITTAELPFDLPPLKQCMFFHEARLHDAGLEWLRNQIRTWINPRIEDA